MTFSAAGTYTLRLTARDGELESYDDVVDRRRRRERSAAGRRGRRPVARASLAHRRPAGDRHRRRPSQPDPDRVVVRGHRARRRQRRLLGARRRWPRTATLSIAGEYVLRLTADDGQLSTADDLTITVHAETPPTLSVSDGSLTEGNDGRGGGELHATLSKSWPRPVTVDFMTSGGSATAHCDYSFRYGTLTFDPGQTEASLLLPVMGELAPEAAETVVVQLGNATEATLATDTAVLTIVDDDAANHASGGAHQPVARGRCERRRHAADADLVLVRWGRRAMPSSMTSISASRPASMARAGSKVCPATAGPGRVVGLRLRRRGRPPRRRRAGERTARSVPGSGSSTTPAVPAVPRGGRRSTPRTIRACDPRAPRTTPPPMPSSWSAAAKARAEAWSRPGSSTTRRATAPLRGSRCRPLVAPADVTRFALAHSPATNRLFLFGGLGADDARRADLWILEGANGSGSATWRHVVPEGVGPSGRDAASLVVDPRGRRLLVFGGSVSDDAASAEVWALNGFDSSSPSWQLASGGPGAAPTPRFGHAAAFDAGSGRMLVFGGTTPGIAENANFVFNDAWLLDGPTWTRIRRPRSGAGRPLRCDRRLLAVREPADRRPPARTTSSPRRPADLWVLDRRDRALCPRWRSGRRPTSYVPAGLDPSATYLWRIVTRDSRGAWRGSPHMAIHGKPGRRWWTPAPDRIVELPPGTVDARGLRHRRRSSGGWPAHDASGAWSAGPAPVAFRAARHPRPPRRSAPQGHTCCASPHPTARSTMHDGDHRHRRAAQRAALRRCRGSTRRSALPQTTATLAGTVTDDGLPTGSALAVEWSQVSGPATGVVLRPFPGHDVGDVEPGRRVRPSLDGQRRARHGVRRGHRHGGTGQRRAAGRCRSGPGDHASHRHGRP